MWPAIVLVGLVNRVFLICVSLVMASLQVNSYLEGLVFLHVLMGPLLTIALGSVMVVLPNVASAIMTITQSASNVSVD